MLPSSSGAAPRPSSTAGYDLLASCSCFFAAARGHWCNLPARPTPRARQHTILTTPARPWPTVRVPQSGRILSNDEPVVLDLSASGLRLAHSTGSAPTTGLAAASTWRLTCPLASAALFGPRPAAPVGPRPPRLPCASRSVALLHPPLSGSSTPGRRAGSAWAPALGSHCGLRGRLRHLRAARSEPIVHALQVVPRPTPPSSARASRLLRA